MLAFAVCIVLAGCSEEDLLDQAANIVHSDDEHVLAVKQGPDDDGDGEPDYTEDNVEIVEFTGRCTYKDVEVKALIQFTLNQDDDTFEATYLSFNEVPQSDLILTVLLEKAFSEGDGVSEE